MQRSVALIICLVVLTAACFVRNSLWQNDMLIWSDALEQSPAKVRGMNELGLYHVSRREFSQATDVFVKSIALNKYQSTIYINLGIAYEGLRRFDDAVKTYRMAMYFQQDDPVPYYNLGILTYKQLHDPQTALDLLLKARDLNPREPDVHLYLGYVYQEQGDLRRAQEEFDLHRMLK